MNTEAMRQALLKAYPGKNWEAKVKKMPDAQVFTVYTRLKNARKI